MVVRRHWAVALSAAGLSFGLSSRVLAQAALPAPTAPAAPVVAPVPELAAGAAAAVAAAPAPIPAPAPIAPEEPLPSPPAALPDLPPSQVQVAPHDAELMPAQPEEEWYESFDVRMFADAYFGWNYNSPRPQTSGNGVIRAFDTSNGFALAWAGLDLSHAAEPIGGTVSLRFGPSAQRYNSSCLSAKCDADYGLSNVKQAFASWRPAGPITVDFGKFDTIYGAEVAESQDNMNYTRGVLYWLGQPVFHTGLRVNAELSENLSLRALIVNGWNNTIDNNTGKTFGLQFTGRAPRNDEHEWISASLGYLGGPERDDALAVSCGAGEVFDTASTSGCSAGTGGLTTGTIDRPTSNTKGWRHFIDLLVTAEPIDSLHLALNADLGVEGVRDPADPTQFSSQAWLGAMLGARYLVSPRFALAGRGEVYKDKHGVTTGSIN
ncbi:MAG: porin, partial [Polyangiaceae bacterium]